MNWGILSKLPRIAGNIGLVLQLVFPIVYHFHSDIYVVICVYFCTSLYGSVILVHKAISFTVSHVLRQQEEEKVDYKGGRRTITDDIDGGYRERVSGEGQTDSLTQLALEID